MAYKLTRNYVGKGGTHVATDSEFSVAVHKLVSLKTPRKIIETGTHLGTGTTKIILSSLKAAGVTDAKFITMEVNPGCYFTAKANNVGENVDCRHGLSLPLSSMPTREHLRQVFANGTFDGIWLDNDPHLCADGYFGETNHLAEDDLLGKALTEFDNKPDMILLDSAGHLGYIEFLYCIDRIKAPCLIVLDDTQHCKHYRSLQYMKEHFEKFEIIVESDEKFGFCIAVYKP